MNPQQQRQRHTVTQQLAADTELVIGQVAKETTQQLEALHDKAMGAVKNARNYTSDSFTVATKTCDERWAATNDAQKRIIERFVAFESRGFWSRLNWLLTGR